MKNLFNETEMHQMISRINHLSDTTQPSWGKMNAAQMLAHCSVAYEMVYENKHAKPNFLVKLLLKAFLKDTVVGKTPYKHNSQSAPAFIIKTEKDFELEKKRLIEYIIKTQQLGGAYFEGKESNAFGKLTTTEWNTMFSKHLEHHLTQFGV